jgi:hypothetical protein
MSSVGIFEVVFHSGSLPHCDNLLTTNRAFEPASLLSWHPFRMQYRFALFPVVSLRYTAQPPATGFVSLHGIEPLYDREA